MTLEFLTAHISFKISEAYSDELTRFRVGQKYVLSKWLSNYVRLIIIIGTLVVKNILGIIFTFCG